MLPVHYIIERLYRTAWFGNPTLSEARPLRRANRDPAPGGQGKLEGGRTCFNAF